MPDENANSLNSNHERRLSVTCRHIDKLLAEMEDALRISSSRNAFPSYIMDVSPAQQRVIEDGIARIREHLINVLDIHGIDRPEPSIPVSRLLHTMLSFIRISIEELKPRYMRGYGGLSPTAEKELNEIVGELLEASAEVDHYVSHELGTKSPDH